MRVGWIITAVDGAAVHSESEYTARLNRTEDGTAFNVSVMFSKVIRTRRDSGRKQGMGGGSGGGGWRSE